MDRNQVEKQPFFIILDLLQAYIEEVSLNGRCGSSLKPDSWNKVKLALETTHSFTITQKQMKNQTV